MLHCCEEYIRAYELHLDGGRMDQLADSIQQLFKERIRSGEGGLPWPPAEMIPTKQVAKYESIYASQFLGWVAMIHKELKLRTATRYG